MRSGALMIQGTGSDVGKSSIVAGLCRIARRRGLHVAPFKPQNMSNNAAVCPGGGEIGRAQAVQARAAGLEPTVDMNPVLLKPQTDRTSQIVLQGKVLSSMEAAEYMAKRRELLPTVIDSFERLTSEYDLVIVEGAGSASEINLRAGDVANMGFARYAKVPVCLLGDIDRGGVIASLVGTRAVLEPGDAALVRSFAINKFRGDPELFTSGVYEIERRTGWDCRGVIPWLEAARRLPQEDTILLEHDQATTLSSGNKRTQMKIVAPMLSRIANFDDVDPVRMEPGVDFGFISPGTPLPRDADVVILLGTKSTLGDLQFMRSQGWDHDVIAHARTGGRVIGLCGGYQMLGRYVHDPHGMDGQAGKAMGLGLLDIETVMQRKKVVRQVSGRYARNDTPLSGYEIHMGHTSGLDLTRPFAYLEGEVEGATSADGRIEGTHIHGIFTNDSFRSSWLAALRGRKTSKLAYEETVERAIDDLGDGLETALDVDALFVDAGVE